MKELFQLSFRCTKLKCGVIWAFCGNVRPGTVFVVMSASVPPLATPRVKSLRAGCGGRQGRCTAAAFSRVGGTVAKSAYYTRLWASFFVKLREKIPGRGLRFLGLFYKIWLLVRKIWQATSFLYLCSPYSPMHRLTLCLLAVNSQPVQ